MRTEDFQELELRIYDLLGNICYSETFLTIQKEITLNLPAGIYVVHLRSELDTYQKEVWIAGN
ncbi:MAG: T9SS type A sorting domain-containing protein [Chitinophagales bacterium]